MIVVVARVAAIVIVRVPVRTPDVLRFVGHIRVAWFDRVMVRVGMMVRRATVVVDMDMGVTMPSMMRPAVDGARQARDREERCKQGDSDHGGIHPHRPIVSVFGPRPRNVRL